LAPTCLCLQWESFAYSHTPLSIYSACLQTYFVGLGTSFAFLVISF